MSIKIVLNLVCVIWGPGYLSKPVSATNLIMMIPVSYPTSNFSMKFPPLIDKNDVFYLYLFSQIVQFSSVAESCLTLCNPMDYSMPGLPVHCQLPEFTQTHVHWVGDAIQASHPLSSLPLTFNLFQHQGLFKWVSSSQEVAKVLELQLQHQSFQWTPTTDFL